jgi:metal-dependent amidase/aminoacylase/carboxypeptidase family protein
MKIARKIHGGTKVKVIEPMLGGEDFSRFLHEAPGTFYFLGTLRKDVSIQTTVQGSKSTRMF